MKKVYIINYLYYDKMGKQISVGGVETYIHNLIRVLNRSGFCVEVYQLADSPFEIENQGVLVHGICIKSDKFVKCVLKKIPKGELVIFANDENVYGKYEGVSINLQHGIGWDYQKRKYRGEIFERIYRYLDKKDIKRRIKNTRGAEYVVCVDYNYVNWFRTQVNYSKSKLIVIPNFSIIPQSIPSKPRECINIIFARRFVYYRGTRIFTEAIKRILNEHDNINVTFAGTGPDESLIKEQLDGFDNVNFITYECDESLYVHSNQHIAVIPSIGSEGTSLSLLEAMASGCAVVCTNVGGMTNIVIDHYNGIMVSPESEQLYTAITKLINDQLLRQELAVNAYNTVSKAFSYDKWEKSWLQLIDEIEERLKEI